MATDLLANFDISEFLGSRPAPSAGRTITLAPGKTTKFTTQAGEEAEIDVMSLKLNRGRSVKSDRDTKSKMNASLDIFAQCVVKVEGEVLPYFQLNGMDALPKHIYVQNWQCTVSTLNELVRHLVAAHNWRYTKNPRLREGQEMGHRWIVSPPAPPLDREGKPDFSNYGVSLEEITIGSSYDEENYADGFRDFATDLRETFENIKRTAEIQDEEARNNAKADFSRSILSLTGGRADGWPRTAQINSLKIGGKTYDLWSVANEEIDLADLVVEGQGQEEGGNRPAAPQAQTAEPF